MNDIEYDFVEFEDESLNHYLHHFGECDDILEYDDEHECIAAASSLIEEIIW